MKLVRFGFLVVVVVGAATGAAFASTAAPRLSGSFPTFFRITAETNIVGISVGQQAVKTWTFTPQCGVGACATVLMRPSIVTGSTLTYRYVLKPISATRYMGSITPTPTYCQLTNGQRFAGAVINHQTLVLNVTKAVGGKVVAYSGTTHTVNTLTAVGRAHGCAAVSVQSAVFHSTG